MNTGDSLRILLKDAQQVLNEAIDYLDSASKVYLQERVDRFKAILDAHIAATSEKHEVPEDGSHYTVKDVQYHGTTETADDNRKGE